MEVICPQLAPDVNGPCCHLLDTKTIKNPAVTQAFGCCWILLDDEMVEGRGIEPPTSTLRTSRSPN